MVNVSNRVTRTIRIERHIDDILKTESQKQNQSVNSIIEQTLLKSIYYNKYYLKHQIQCINPTELDTLLTNMSEPEIITAGENAGNTRAKDTLQTLEIDPDFNSFKWFIMTILSKYSGWFTSSYYITDKTHVFLLNHKLSKKWSIFLKSYLESMAANILDIDIEATITDKSINLKIPI